MERLEAVAVFGDVVLRQLRSGGWRQRLREQPAALRALAVGAVEVARALARVEERARCEGWEHPSRIMSTVEKVKEQREALRELVRRKVGVHGSFEECLAALQPPPTPSDQAAALLSSARSALEQAAHFADALEAVAQHCGADTLDAVLSLWASGSAAVAGLWEAVAGAPAVERWLRQEPKGVEGPSAVLLRAVHWKRRAGAVIDAVLEESVAPVRLQSSERQAVLRWLVTRWRGGSASPLELPRAGLIKLAIALNERRFHEPGLIEAAQEAERDSEDLDLPRVRALLERLVVAEGSVKPLAPVYRTPRRSEPSEPRRRTLVDLAVALQNR